MCALWTKDKYPDDPDLLKIYLPRNLSRTSPPSLPHMHRLYLWREPPIHNLCSYENNGLLGNTSLFSREELSNSSEHFSQSKVNNNQAVITIPEVLSDQNCSNQRDPTKLVDNFDEYSTSHLTINFQNSKSLSDNSNSSQNHFVNSSNSQGNKLLAASNLDEKTRLSPIYQENDLENLGSFTPKRRSSSLRSVKDSTTTPVRKAVRFADAFGLDLVKVNHIFNSELPSNSSFTNGHPKRKLNYFVLGFSLSTDKEITYREALNKGLTLENCMVDKNTLTGTIRLRSLTLHKHVFVRITYDNWATFLDIQAYYVQDSFDGMTDRFSFVIILPNNTLDNKIAFAICYCTNDGQTFWDNNHGSNYSIDCISRSVGSNAWMHFI